MDFGTEFLKHGNFEKCGIFITWNLKMAGVLKNPWFLKMDGVLKNPWFLKMDGVFENDQSETERVFFKLPNNAICLKTWT